MQLKHLTLTHIRAFNQAEITFQPSMNLIVGINGVGKSTLLDTLRILLSQALPKLFKARSKALDFEYADITVEQDYLTAELAFEVADTQFSYAVHQPRARYVLLNSTGEVREQTYAAPVHRVLTTNEKTISKSLKSSLQQPLAIYFSPRRALVTTHTYTKSSALRDALDHRELRLMEFADWFFAQKNLAEENAPTAQNHLNALDIAVKRFLDTCGNLRVQRDSSRHQDKNGKVTQKFQATFLIDKSGVQLDIRQLSDGERGILALVLDLARRLSIANPHLDDPLQGSAVVLIDELDLHLHPQWQRTIVQKLTTTFPNCQFIATTHSPLIIGEVPPENIILIAADGEIIHPHQSLGMDTDWILKYIMGATTRHTETTLELKRIADLIETEDYDAAIDAIDILRDQIGEFPELVRLQTRVDRFQMLGE
jgi:predicted ATP-binding protein involved in virulence